MTNTELEMTQAEDKVFYLSPKDFLRVLCENMEIDVVDAEILKEYYNSYRFEYVWYSPFTWAYKWNYKSVRSGYEEKYGADKIQKIMKHLN